MTSPKSEGNKCGKSSPVKEKLGCKSKEESRVSVGLKPLVVVAVSTPELGQWDALNADNEAVTTITNFDQSNGSNPVTSAPRGTPL